jgi:hypothetical protein
MSGIFRAAATETGSIRAETGSFWPPRMRIFALPANVAFFARSRDAYSRYLESRGGSL